MDSAATQRQLPMATINIMINKVTERPAVNMHFW